MRRSSISYAGRTAMALSIAAVAAVATSMTFAHSETFDARWLALGAAPKQDRLAPPRRDLEVQTFSYTNSAARTTIVQKAEILPVKPETPAAPVAPVRDVPQNNAAKEKLPDGCEPSFSPVAQPSLAHVTGRCFAAREDGRKVAELTR